jgi:predicted nucleic acid-binding protein
MIAIDTNVFVYRYDRQEHIKQPIAKKLIAHLSRSEESLLLWQVAGEFLKQLTYWQNHQLMERATVNRIMLGVTRQFTLVMPTPTVLDQAMSLFDRYSLQHWDSMLLGACLEAGVTTLYTEDMGAPRKIDTIELINPF